MRKATYTRRSLIKMLKDYKKTTGLMPSLNKIRNRKDVASVDTYLRFFGSWINALKASGFDINKISRGLKTDKSKWQHEINYKRPKALNAVWKQEYPAMLKENIKKDYQFSDK